MERFEELKQELLKRAKDADACKEQYARAYGAQTLEQLMRVCRDNFRWACLHGVLDIDIIKLYHDEFASGSIYANEDTIRGYLLCKDATVSVFGNTGNTNVVAFGNARVRAFSNASVVAFDNVIVRAFNNVRVIAFNNASVRAYDNARVIASNNARVEAFGNVIVRASDNASVEAYNSAYIASYLVLEVKLSDNAIYRILNNNTIRYANPKMKFELLE